MKPLVSILIPIYGVEKYIEKCVRSLFEQSYESIEYIFVNDCSPDKSIDILRGVLSDYPIREKNVKIINHENNIGLAGTRNTALKNASGDFVLFMDSDDYLDNNVVEKLVASALSDNANIVIYDMRYVYEDKEVIVHHSIKSNPIDYVCQLLTYKVGVGVCGKLIDRKLFTNNHIEFIEGLNFGEDYVTSPRIAYFASKITYCPNIYYNYVQYNSSSYTQGYSAKNIDDLKRAIEVLREFFSTKSKFNFREYFNEVYLINKVKLLISICLHYKQVGCRLREVSLLFIESDDYSHKLPKSYQLILFLSKHKLFGLLRLYVVLGYKVKHFIK